MVYRGSRPLSSEFSLAWVKCTLRLVFVSASVSPAVLTGELLHRLRGCITSVYQLAQLEVKWSHRINYRFNTGIHSNMVSCELLKRYRYVTLLTKGRGKANP